MVSPKVLEAWIKLIHEYKADITPPDYMREDMSAWGVYDEILRATLTLYESVQAGNLGAIRDSSIEISVLSMALGINTTLKLNREAEIARIMKECGFDEMGTH